MARTFLIGQTTLRATFSDVERTSPGNALGQLKRTDSDEEKEVGVVALILETEATLLRHPCCANMYDDRVAGDVQRQVNATNFVARGLDVPPLCAFFFFQEYFVGVLPCRWLRWRPLSL